jgi:hypothetical protein
MRKMQHKSHRCGKSSLMRKVYAEFVYSNKTRKYRVGSILTNASPRAVNPPAITLRAQFPDAAHETRLLHLFTTIRGIL